MSATAIYLTRDTDIDTRDSGDEIDVWHVYAGDDFAEPCGKVYTCRTMTKAYDLGERMARDRRLELVVG